MNGVPTIPGIDPAEPRHDAGGFFASAVEAPIARVESSQPTSCSGWRTRVRRPSARSSRYRRLSDSTLQDELRGQRSGSHGRNHCRPGLRLPRPAAESLKHAGLELIADQNCRWFAVGLASDEEAATDGRLPPVRPDSDCGSRSEALVAVSRFPRRIQA